MKDNTKDIKSSFPEIFICIVIVMKILYFLCSGTQRSDYPAVTAKSSVNLLYFIELFDHLYPKCCKF